MTRTGNILIVEDECVNAVLLEHQLIKLGYSVSGTARSGEEAIQIARDRKPDLVLMDVELEGAMDGVEAAGIIRSRHDIPVVFLTGNSDENVIDRAGQTGAHAYLCKPFHSTELHSTLQIALNRAETEVHIREERKWLSTTVRCIHDGVIAVDALGRVKLINPAAERLTGWSEREALGRDISIVFRALEPETGRAAACPVKRVLTNQSLSNQPSRKLLLTKEGSTILIEERAASIENEAGAIIGVVLVFSGLKIPSADCA